MGKLCLRDLFNAICYIPQSSQKRILAMNQEIKIITSLAIHQGSYTFRIKKEKEKKNQLCGNQKNIQS